MAAFAHFALLSPAASIGVVLAALLLPAAHGADKKAATNPPPSSKGSLLTPAQLRECVTQKEKLGKDTDSVVRAKTELATVKVEIDSTGTALNEEGTTLDRTSADAVAAYNAKVIERNNRIDAYQSKVAAYNNDAEAVLAAKEAYEKACANRRYDERDLNDMHLKK